MWVGPSCHRMHRKGSNIVHDVRVGCMRCVHDVTTWIQKGHAMSYNIYYVVLRNNMKIYFKVVEVQIQALE
jgi:hypothetical protein